MHPGMLNLKQFSDAQLEEKNTKAQQSIFCYTQRGCKTPGYS